VWTWPPAGLESRRQFPHRRPNELLAVVVITFLRRQRLVLTRAPVALNPPWTAPDALATEEPPRDRAGDSTYPGVKTRHPYLWGSLPALVTMHFWLRLLDVDAGTHMLERGVPVRADDAGKAQQRGARAEPASW